MSRELLLLSKVTGLPKRESQLISSLLFIINAINIKFEDVNVKYVPRGIIGTLSIKEGKDQ